MALTVDEVADFLEGVAGVTYDVRVGKMPEDPDSVIVVRDYAGRADLGFGVDGIQHETVGIQIRARGGARDYDGPRSQIELAYRALAGVQGEALGGTEYLICRPQSAPFELETDEQDRTVFAVSFLCEKEPS